jgi:putative ABC transport system permease protein
MNLRRGVRPSLRALFAHRVRAMLALTSVSVGVGAVIVTSAIGAGAQREIMRSIERSGTNMLVVRPAQVQRLVARKKISGAVRTLELDDYDAIGGLALVSAAAPGVESNLRVKAGAIGMKTKVLGTSAAFPDVRRFRLRIGRFFDDEDDRAARRVAVLGARVSDTLFPGENALGQEMRIRGVPFEVIGVLQPKGALGDAGDEDDQVLVPIRTALRRVFNVTWLSTVFVSVIDMQHMDEAQGDITALLRARHRTSDTRAADDFEVQNVTRFLAIQQQAADSLTWLTTGLAALALLVGGTGILALMLLSVRERTSEIGLRLAVGATPRDILIQFLLEATLLALGGWMLGALLGASGAAMVAFSTTWPIGLPIGALLASLAMAVTTGLGFGAWPARTAARMLPIGALRTE